MPARYSHVDRIISRARWHGNISGLSHCRGVARPQQTPKQQLIPANTVASRKTANNGFSCSALDSRGQGHARLEIYGIVSVRAAFCSATTRLCFAVNYTLISSSRLNNGRETKKPTIEFSARALPRAKSFPFHRFIG